MYLNVRLTILRQSQQPKVPKGESWPLPGKAPALTAGGDETLFLETPLGSVPACFGNHAKMQCWWWEAACHVANQKQGQHCRATDMRPVCLLSLSQK